MKIFCVWIIVVLLFCCRSGRSSSLDRSFGGRTRSHRLIHREMATFPAALPIRHPLFLHHHVPLRRHRLRRALECPHCGRPSSDACHVLAEAMAHHWRRRGRGYFERAWDFSFGPRGWIGAILGRVECRNEVGVHTDHGQSLSHGRFRRGWWGGARAISAAGGRRGRVAAVPEDGQFRSLQWWSPIGRAEAGLLHKVQHVVSGWHGGPDYCAGF